MATAGSHLCPSPEPMAPATCATFMDSVLIVTSITCCVTSSATLPSWTFKQGCPMFISVRIAASGDKFEVVDLMLEHNHPVSQQLYKHLPHQRKLSEPEKEKAMSLLGMKANKKLVQESLSQQSGNIILLKDLSKLSTQAKKGNRRNDLDSVAKLLIEKYGACVEVCSDDEQNFRGLLFKDKQMSEAFEAYSELLFMDATYKLLDLNLPVFIMLCEDSNGQSEVVAVCILVSEDANGIKWMLQKFKCNNGNWDKIRVVMADKDLKERQVVKEMFPSASVLICLFHTLRTFQREVTCEKLGITAAQRSMCLIVVQKIVHFTSSTEYDKLYDQIKTFPKRVKEYYDDNWHKIKD
uniref:ZSWIM1/3 RNaseH-like domain-containing protein n=1 Tax=Amphimedon queenslandica TaxID=400682 RepID=A0A1X7VIP8_AMPQE